MPKQKETVKVHNANAINPKVSRLPSGQIEIIHGIDPNRRAPRHIKEFDINLLQSLILDNARSI